MEDLICLRCQFLCSTEDIDKPDYIVKQLLSIEESTAVSGPCRLCLGLFNMSQIKEKLIIIRDKLKEYDRNAYKIITSFSCLFSLFHHYLKQKIAAIENSIETKVYLDNIHTSTLRKCFKPLLTPFITDIIGEAPLYEAEVGIYISFNFSNQSYSYISEFVSSLDKVNKYEITAVDDISKIKTILNNIFNPVIVNGFDNAFNWKEVSLDIQLKINTEEVYIKGNYLKFNRELSQTKWEKEGIRLSASSVDEEIKKSIIKYYQCDTNADCIISAGGREDRDVRMLGNGRQFIYRISNARKRYNIDYLKLITFINANSSLIQVKNIVSCKKKEFSTVAKCSEAKLKKYLCVIWCEKEINEDMMKMMNEMKNVKIMQKTPLRVIHKRVLMTRDKEIIQMNSARMINEHFFTLEILASAGTYIKEFVHSDIGRTHPSIASILNCDCDILQLDVLDIIYDTII